MPADQVMPLYRERLGQIEAIIRTDHIATLYDWAEVCSSDIVFY